MQVRQLHDEHGTRQPTPAPALVAIWGTLPGETSRAAHPKAAHDDSSIIILAPALPQRSENRQRQGRGHKSAVNLFNSGHCTLL